MSSCADLAEIISNLPEPERSGSLMIWGQWFGRPFDNNHQCTSCVAEEDRIVPRFSKGERLTIWNPGELSSGPGRLAIGQASRVRWEWYHYGRPVEPESLRFSDHERHDNGIRTTTDESPRGRNRPHSEDFAVQLIGS